MPTLAERIAASQVPTQPAPDVMTVSPSPDVPNNDLPAGAVIPTQSLAEMQAQLAQLSAAFAESRAREGAIQRELDSMRAARESLAEGKTPILFAHCNHCGQELTASETEKDATGRPLIFCADHPNGLVNHVGVNPMPEMGGGKLVLVKQHTGIAA